MVNLEEYIKNGMHRAGCPSWLKVRELDVLMCITPGPLGLGMSYKQASDFLSIGLSTVKRAAWAIRDRFPEAWSRLQGMRRCMERQRVGLHSPRSMDGLLASMGHEGLSHILADSSQQPPGTAEGGKPEGVQYSKRK